MAASGRKQAFSLAQKRTAYSPRAAISVDCRFGLSIGPVFNDTSDCDKKQSAEKGSNRVHNRPQAPEGLLYRRGLYRPTSTCCQVGGGHEQDAAGEGPEVGVVTPTQHGSAQPGDKPHQ
jgi:hypothetical protein